MSVPAMNVQFGNSTFELVLGDITKQDTDAIVNAANTTLLGGGGVDGAIHVAAGPQLMGACRRLSGCKTGSAKITPGFELKAKYVIHAVGPVYFDGIGGEPKLLASAYRKSLELAVQHNCNSVAFPAISTGAYGYPVEKAAEVAIRTILTFMRSHPCLTLVRFVLFDEKAYLIHAKVLHNLTN